MLYTCIVLFLILAITTALSNGSVQQMMVCSGAQVTLTCTCTLTTDLWKLPVGTCPDKNDSILLTEGANQNCGGTLGTCGPYRAQGSGPDSSSGRCLTSTLTFVANTTVTILCDLTNQVVISITAPPGPLTVPNFSTLNETYLTVSWAPPTTGGVPTSYNVSINDSSSPVVIPGTGSSLYTHTFTGLASNTPYSISVVAINCAGTSNTATVNNYTLAGPPSNIQIIFLFGPDIASSINITWLAMAGVRTYIVGISNQLMNFSVSRRATCTVVPLCFYTVNVPLEPGTYDICLTSVNRAGITGSPYCSQQAFLLASPGDKPLSSYLYIFACTCVLMHHFDLYAFIKFLK